MKMAKQLLAAVLLGVLFSGCINPVPSNHLSATLPNGAKLELDTRKNTGLTNVMYSHTQYSTNGVTNVFTLSIGALSSVNDPQVIGKSYAGQAAVIKAQSDALHQAFEDGKAAAAQVATGL